MIGLTKDAAVDYAQGNIRVNAVCPGIIDTEMMQRHTGGTSEERDRVIASEPVVRMGTPEEIAAAVLWWCSDAATFRHRTRHGRRRRPNGVATSDAGHASRMRPRLWSRLGTATTQLLPLEENNILKIRLTVDDQIATATLDDSQTAQDFASMLPLTLHVHDLFGREKPGQLPHLLNPGKGQATYQVGDLGYWAPSHDLAIFYATTARPSPAQAS